MGKVRSIITDDEMRVRSLYGASQMVKSYVRYFMDTDQFDSIPDEDGERRFLVICCNPEMTDAANNRDGAYWNELREAINDDRAVRALYLTFMAREGVKERYFGQDIPVGEYARTLKDTNRPHNEKFLIWLVQQHLDKAVLVRDVDELFEEDFKAWKETGGEFERSKASFTSWLRLRKFDLPKDTITERRVTKEKKASDTNHMPDWVNGQRVQKPSKPTYQVTEFRFDVRKLCKHYQLGCNTNGTLGPNFGGSVIYNGDSGNATDGGGAASSAQPRMVEQGEAADVGSSSAQPPAATAEQDS